MYTHGKYKHLFFVFKITISYNYVCLFDSISQT